jgi:ABC-type dipeptide/oligopeptide/nickel transport system ATPase component
MESILKVEDLSVVFKGPEESFRAVDGISFEVEAGKITCVVGQSGSGKSMTALSIINRVPILGEVSGKVIFKERNLLDLCYKEMREIRGRHIFSIFQHPMNSLNPSVKIGKQLFAFVKSHGVKGKKQFYQEITEILDTLGFSNSNLVLEQYPFQLSGGMLQRVMIALAIWMKPEIIIADEPTTALDAIVQKEILKQLSVIRKMFDVSILLITHDLGVVAEIADDVIVMKDGNVVEKGSVFRIFNDPQAPYTKSLLSATFRKEACLVC